MSTMSMISGVSGMKTNQTKLNVIGNNVSNMSTTGYKKSEIRFEDMIYSNIKYDSKPTDELGGINPSQVGSGVGVANIVKNMGQGSLKPTTRTSDFGIDGNGFFTIEKDGVTKFTRDGSFSLDANGDLINANGYRLLDTNNNVMNVPKEVEVDKEIKKVLSYNVSLDGSVSLGLDDGTRVDDYAKMKIAQFVNPDGLSMEGHNLYSTTSNSGEPMYLDSHGGVVQGYLELSNVDIVDEFTEMMLANKGLQASSKVVTASDQALDTVLNIIR